MIINIRTVGKDRRILAKTVSPLFLHFRIPFLLLITVRDYRNKYENLKTMFVII